LLATFAISERISLQWVKPAFKNKRNGKGGSNRDRRHSKVGYAEIEMLLVVLHLVASRSRKKIEGDYHCLMLCHISPGGGSSVIVFIGDSSHPARGQCLNY
jgi:hypothetical protein